MYLYRFLDFGGSDENDPEKKTKIPIFSDFQCFYAIFVNFLIDIVNENVENVQQGKNLLSSSHY